MSRIYWINNLHVQSYFVNAHELFGQIFSLFTLSQRKVSRDFESPPTLKVLVLLGSSLRLSRDPGGCTYSTSATIRLFKMFHLETSEPAVSEMLPRWKPLNSLFNQSSISKTMLSAVFPDMGLFTLEVWTTSGMSWRGSAMTVSMAVMSAMEDRGEPNVWTVISPTDCRACFWQQFHQAARTKDITCNQPKNKIWHQFIADVIWL